MGIFSRDELAAITPFRVFSGDALSYMREGLRPTTAFINDAGSNMQAASTGTSDKVIVPVRRVGSDVDVDGLADDLNPSEMGLQVARKAQATWDLVRTKIVRGGNTTSHTLGSSADPFAAIAAIQYGPWLDPSRYGDGEIKYTHVGTTWQFRGPGDNFFGDPVTANADGTYTLKSWNPSKWITVTLTVGAATTNGTTHITFVTNNDEFDGLSRIMDPAFVIDPVNANGDQYTFAILDNLMRTERVRAATRVFVMTSKMKLRHLSHQRALGGFTPENLQIPGYGGVVDSYRGVRILECDEIPDETVGANTACSSIYLASLDPEDGLFMGVPGVPGSTTINVTGDPRVTPVMGFRVERIGPLEGKPHRRTRVQWYGALGLRNTKALARARGISQV